MDLRLAGFARQVLAEGDDGGRGNLRTVRPERRKQVRNGNDMDIVDRGFQAGDGGHGLAQTVHGDDRLLEPAGSEPLGNGHLLGNPHLVKLDARPVELLHGLDEIPRVGPQAGVVEGDAKVARLAREPGHPFDLFPPPGGIFAGMGVASGQNDGVPSLLQHQGANGLHTLRKDVFHGMIIDIFHKYKYICRYLKLKHHDRRSPRENRTRRA